jgi:hypothetical protein
LAYIILVLFDHYVGIYRPTYVIRDITRVKNRDRETDSNFEVQNVTKRAAMLDTS